MEQFDILINKSEFSKKDVPYLINLQSDPMDLLATRIVAPLRETLTCSDEILTKIHIPISINNKEYTIFISELAAIPLGLLGNNIINANFLRQECIAAIDILFTGF